MIRQGDWKLIHHLGAPHQLFNLSTDPDELENRYKTHPEVAQGLEAELRKICSPEEEDARAEAFIEGQLDGLAKS